MYGNAASIDKLYTICKKKNIKIVEDAAESLGSRYLKGKFKNKHTGTIGEMGAVSFNGNKIITSGGGGMILTNNKYLTGDTYTIADTTMAVCNTNPNWM